MKILLATPLYPPDVGGPATYAKGLETAFQELGHQVEVISYGSVMHSTSGLRQIIFSFMLLRKTLSTNVVIALDTLSIGLPASFWGRIFGKPVLVRVAGDRLWESYVTRTGDPVPFPEFYRKSRNLTLLEGLSYWLTKITFLLSRRVIFSTRWQMDVRLPAYPTAKNKSLLVENAYQIEPKIRALEGEHKIFLWAGRDIPLKNVLRMQEAFVHAKRQHPEIMLKCLTGVTHDVVMENIQSAYALILPSYSEDSPNFLLEGIAEGKPFVTTKFNGLTDRIGELGIFVDPRDTTALTNAIKLMASNEVHDGYVRRISEFKFVRTYTDLANDYLAIIKTI